LSLPRIGARRALLFPLLRLLPGVLLLEFLHLLLHELASQRLLFEAERVVSAVRATLPSFRIGLVA